VHALETAITSLTCVVCRAAIASLTCVVCMCAEVVCALVGNFLILLVRKGLM